MKIQKLFIGGWFQRTALHLSEIFDFLNGDESPLNLDSGKLVELREKLSLDTVQMKIRELEFVEITTKNKIITKIFEDGLIVLSKSPEGKIKDDIDALRHYYEKSLSPAISYLFSLGAPVPKELAKIKTIYPYFVILEKSSSKEIKDLLNEFSENKQLEVIRKDFEIHRGNKLYVINNNSKDFSDIEAFVYEQIFFREFKGQLHRYLNIHRVIWEKIANVKEMGKIRGKDVGSFKNKVESYQKTINLIGTRINQMDTYIHTRESIVKSNEELSKFFDILQFKYKTLSDTLDYIKDLWQMTENYVDSALDLFTSIQAKSTERSVANLAVITSMGVGATLIGLFTQKAPNFTVFGFVYFLILVAVGYITNKVMEFVFTNRMYKIKDIKTTEEIN